MAFMECRFHSAVLGKEVPVNVVFPRSGTVRGRKVLYLLHGLSDDASVWFRRTSIERYADALNFIVIMPDGGRGFYTDAVHGAAYWTFLATELPEMMKSVFRLPTRREDTFAAGLSMGGYGALKLAFLRPERFAAAGVLSAVTDIRRRFRAADSAAWRPELRLIFGGVSRLAARDNDLFVLAEKAATSGRPLPEIISFCGTEDFMIADNRCFNRRMKTVKYPGFHAFERPGSHTWEFWDTYIQDILRFFADRTLPV